jgi:hypothetical protein
MRCAAVLVFEIHTGPTGRYEFGRLNSQGFTLYPTNEDPFVGAPPGLFSCSPYGRGRGGGMEM